MKIVGIVQARVTSTRLPNKVLMPLGNESVLECVVRRARFSKLLSAVILAIPDNRHNDVLMEFAQQKHVEVFRGSENDLVARYYSAAKKHRADIVVRLTADNPIVDGRFIDWAVRNYLLEAVDYLAAKPGGESGIPNGLSVEVFSYEILSRIHKEDTNTAWREHVTPYLYKNPLLFTTRYLKLKKDYTRLRLTIDTLEDYRVLAALWASFKDADFSWASALALMNTNQELRLLNSNVTQVEI